MHVNYYEMSIFAILQPGNLEIIRDEQQIFQ